MKRSRTEMDAVTSWYWRMMDTERYLANYQKKTDFIPKCLYLCRYRKRSIFSIWSQKNVAFVNMLIFWYIWAKNDFYKWSQNNMLFLELWIFSDIWIQNYFFKRISKNVALDICRSFGIYICQKTIFRSDLRKTSIFSKRWYFWISGQKTIFSKIYMS